MDSWLSSRWLVPGLLGLLALQCLASGFQKSATADEPLYLAAGERILRHGDVETNEISSPFLMKPILALPTLWLRPPSDSGEVFREGSLLQQWRYSRDRLYGGDRDPHTVLMACRVVNVLLSMLLGLSTFLLARDLFGRPVALLALTLFAFLPAILAHARLATLDIGLALVSVECLRWMARYLRDGGWKPVLTSSLFLALALLTKTAAIALAFYLGLVLVVLGFKASRSRRPHPWPALIVAFVTTLVFVNGAFFFRGSMRPLADLERGGPLLEGAVARLDESGLGWAARQVPVPLPGSFQRLMLEQAGRTSSPKPVYFRGELQTGKVWWLAPVLWTLKTPVAMTLAVLLGWWVLIARRGDTQEANRRLLVLGFIPFLFFFYMGVSQFGLVRYLLPIEPLMAIVGAWGLVSIGRPSRAGRWFAVAATAGVVIASASTFPHYLPFVNYAAGGPKSASYWVADANVDWGQDLRGLSDYMQSQGLDAVWLAYFGSGDPKSEGLRYRYLPSVGLPPEPGGDWWYEQEGEDEIPSNLHGLVAISATCRAGTLFDGRDPYAAFRGREPIATIGHSILIYELPPVP